MQFSILISTIIALAATTSAAPAPQTAVIDCWSTCSTNCVQSGLLRGGLCDASGTCTCLTGTKREAEPMPAPQLECYETCSTNCIAAGDIEGGMCDAAGTCTCL
ncbi:uncharacterized protein LY89DRAFT_687384 [Mollisia scopiformis]|uniref:Uncharacterized protein n=1 Tax=Mollisia scopiformis TaxID=149040 RepID=A0A194WYW3_MOLSC|nr:uncharacterized protein LY89DRAFT_687384 [Mollisia scopiformis]KUJ13153.1 hypothetical protein LY89DRAFT_687384 [Mollisia scopiformis]